MNKKYKKINNILIKELDHELFDEPSCCTVYFHCIEKGINVTYEVQLADGRYDVSLHCQINISSSDKADIYPTESEQFFDYIIKQAEKYFDEKFGEYYE